MSDKPNCWEIKKCGRQPGGSRVNDLGVCPAASDTRANGLNGGSNGGRLCWAISGTLCGGRIQGIYAKKLSTCTGCDFFMQVKREEGERFVLLKPGQKLPPEKKK